jgi:ketose-bisphosphate aldolase
MGLISLPSVFKKAHAGGYAIGAFNTYNLEVTEAIARAASELESPIIFQITPGAIEYAGLPQIFDIVRNAIVEHELQAAIHLDHALDFGIVKKCLDIGFNSVMIDGSTLPFSSNVSLTQKVVNYAKEFGAAVEAEIGVISHSEGGQYDESGEFTDPDLACKFMEETHIDSLAVSIGNEHGAPKGEKLNFKLLSEICDKVEKPIVIHGASGLTRGEIKKAIKAGALKFNIDTNIRRTFLKGFSDNYDGKEEDPRKILNEVKADITKLIKDYIVIFGSGGKANV